MTTIVRSAAGGPSSPQRPAGPAPRPGRRRRRSATADQDARAAAVLVTPSLVMFGVFILLPTLTGAALSLFSWDFFGAPRFVGLENYLRLGSDVAVLPALFVTLKFLAFGIVPTIVLGFALAVLVSANLPGMGALRFLYFVPIVVSVAVSGVLWATLYSPRQGPLSALLRTVGIAPPSWLSDSTWSVPALSVMMIWLALPVVILLYLAAVQRIPDDLYSAAALDGASAWRQLWSITWPSVMPTTVLVSVMQLLNFASANLDVTLIMTQGGPLYSTRSLALYAYETAFQKLDVG
ncbi:sugar ABC transporter permease, partial [Microbacterium sp.]|uniref:carbohydrate ABC transporter permease n=1 Tax=Microbacterium sp. TaxID=51671 RepID=UPI003342BAC8